MFSSEVRKGSTELLILSLVEDKPRHGYEIGKLIEVRSGGRLRPSIPSLYPTLCRMERRGWIKGNWVERPSERRRRYYRLTPAGLEAARTEAARMASLVEAARGKDLLPGQA